MLIGDKVIAEGVLSPYILKGLTASTEYAVRVVNALGETETLLFTTADETYKEVTLILDFKDKVEGDSDINPHSYHRNWSSDLLPPSNAGYEENDQTSYEAIANLDGIVDLKMEKGSSAVAKVLFKFNVLESIKRIYPKLFTDLNFEGQINLLKANVTSWKASIHGFGSGISGYGLTMALFRESAWGINADEVNKTEQIKEIMWDTNFARYLQQDGFIYVLAYAGTGSTTVESAVNIDYANLEITLLIQD